MNNYTREDILRMVEEEDVGFIRLQFTDIFGTLKNIAITTSQLERALDNQIMFDGSSIDGFARVEESDMYLFPDLNTFEIFPWRPQQGKVARMICDVHQADGSVFKSDPRYVLKTVLADAAEMGYEFQVGPECEFFLFHTDDDGLPTTISHEKAGYFDLGPLDLGENARRDIVLTMEDMGCGIEASHHEVAPAQHEIDIEYDEALSTADNIMTFKLVAKTIAKRHGLHATFMPKPKYGINGSGMHINMSLHKEGVNIFYDENDINGLSKEAYYFIGGIMQHMKAISFITNPIVNSYKRLIPGYEAPVCIVTSLGKSVTEASRNRTILVGLIRDAKNPMATRFELRAPNPKSNTYLILATCYMAMLDGIRQALTQEKTPADLEKSISKKYGEDDFYLETEREYRSENNVFEDYTEEEREKLFGVAPATVWENLQGLRNNPEKVKAIQGGVINDLAIESFFEATLNQWKMELHNRDIPNYMDIVRECVKLHKEDATDYDVVNWTRVNDLRFYIGKDTMSEKCLLTRAKEALDRGDYGLASDLQVELQQKISRLIEYYLVYKKNLF